MKTGILRDSTYIVTGQLPSSVDWFLNKGALTGSPFQSRMISRIIMDKRFLKFIERKQGIFSQRLVNRVYRDKNKEQINSHQILIVPVYIYKFRGLSIELLTSKLHFGAHVVGSIPTSPTNRGISSTVERVSYDSNSPNRSLSNFRKNLH